MQIKVFSVPVVGGDGVNEALNAFLRSKKVLQVDQVMVQVGGTAYWSYSVRYVEDYSPETKGKPRIDYMEILSPEAFARFRDLRAITAWRRLDLRHALPPAQPRAPAGTTCRMRG